MNCPRCDTPIPEGRPACPQCGMPRPRAGQPAPVAKPVNCPICKIPAYTAEIAGQPVLHCAECGGTGIRKEALAKLMPHGPKEMVIGPDERGHRTPPFFEKRAKPPFLICPFCGKRMEEKKLGPMTADVCSACRALWLDGEKWLHLNDVLGPYKWQSLKDADRRR